MFESHSGKLAKPVSKDTPIVTQYSQAAVSDNSLGLRQSGAHSLLQRHTLTDMAPAITPQAPVPPIKPEQALYMWAFE